MKLAGRTAASQIKIQPPRPAPHSQAANRFKLIHLLGIDTATPEGLARTLPFSPSDTTAGAENEYQTAVVGDRCQVDLACEIEDSGFFRNLRKRALRGETPRSTVTALEAFLSDNDSRVWENSWVRLPMQALTTFARSVFKDDLRSDKSCADSPQRSDACRFSTRTNGREYLRIPISYLLKLALADAVGEPSVHATIQEIGHSAMNHFLSDNTSPETFSFHPVPMDDQSGKGKKSFPGDIPALPALATADSVCQPAVRTDRQRSTGGPLFCAPSPGAPETPQQPDFRQLLSISVHEPLPVRLE
jgi:hypothetical protein